MKNKHKHEDIICNICKLVIDTSKEFCEFIHYEKKSHIKSTAFYHVECFRDRMSGGQKLRELQSKADSIMELAKMRLS